MNLVALWLYIVSPTGPSLGPVALQVLLVSLLLAIGGIALVVLPKELASRAIPGFKPKGGGVRERELIAELRVKIGTSITIWSSALILALLLRLLGTVGLDTRFLPALVVLFLPIMVVYGVIYRIFFYPHYLQAARQIDNRKSYEPVAKKSKGKKSSDHVNAVEKIKLMPGKAMVGLIGGAFLYYIVMIAISVPPDVPPQNHDHALHQLGMPVMALLGYLIGLTISLGDDIRERARWLTPAHK